MPKKNRYVKCIFCNGLKDYRAKTCRNCFKEKSNSHPSGLNNKSAEMKLYHSKVKLSL
jgi:hypothetical protein